jgi:hypothetical protein
MAAGYGRSSQRLLSDIHELCHEIVHPAAPVGVDILDPRTSIIEVGRTARSVRCAPTIGPSDQ